MQTKRTPKKSSFICRACESANLIEMLDLGSQPIAFKLLNSVKEKPKKYPLALYFCQACGLAQIVNPVAPEELYQEDTYWVSSWKSQPHSQAEVEMILSCVSQGAVVEIGSNDGMFLELLKKNGFKSLVGIEPNHSINKLAREKGFYILEGFLNKSVGKKAVRKYGRFKLVVARQILEHVSDLHEFFNCVHMLLLDDGYVFIAVPDFEVALAVGDCAVVYDEHINHFTQPVLERTLEIFGFKPVMVQKYAYSGGILAILAKEINSNQRKKAFLSVDARTNEQMSLFRSKVNSYASILKKTLQELRKKGFTIVLYGVGVRGSALVNALNLGNLIDFAVDDQKKRQGKYLPAGKIPIRDSAVLAQQKKPLLCLLAVGQENESVVKEKTDRIKKNQVKYLSLLSPTNILEEVLKLRKDLLNKV
jgi:2-polyprenyl-3-methyl-5-hydroxy-6-metoxy-1,4-benzoquinol methylase